MAHYSTPKSNIHMLNPLRFAHIIHLTSAGCEGSLHSTICPAFICLYPIPCPILQTPPGSTKTHRRDYHVKEWRQEASRLCYTHHCWRTCWCNGGSKSQCSSFRALHSNEAPQLCCQPLDTIKVRMQLSKSGTAPGVCCEQH